MLNRYGCLSDRIYALPETPSSQMLFYRKDLFEDTAIRRLYQEKTHNILQPPTTFEEYNQIAAFFTRELNPQSPTRYGTGLTLGNTGVAATEFLCRYFALTQDLFDADDQILLTSDAAIQALRELVESRSYASPIINSWWRDTAHTFANGDTAMTILYSNYASELTGKASRIRGNIGYAMVPGGNPLYGGGSIGVSRYSKNKELAYHFIKWLCSENVATAMTLLGSVSPCKETYNNYQVIDTYPWLSMSKECFEKANAHRFPHTSPDGFNERRFLSILGTQVLGAINGNCSIADALHNAAYSYHKNLT
jgi:multiple sugar transport system substrate-binding protein